VLTLGCPAVCTCLVSDTCSLHAFALRLLAGRLLAGRFFAGRGDLFTVDPNCSDCLKAPATTSLAVMAIMAVLAGDNSNTVLQAIAAAVIGWLTWYTCKFVLYPVVYRDEPRELPYLIPCKRLSSVSFQN
jgi:hypothetical protein